MFAFLFHSISESLSGGPVMFGAMVDIAVVATIIYIVVSLINNKRK